MSKTNNLEYLLTEIDNLLFKGKVHVFMYYIIYIPYIGIILPSPHCPFQLLEETWQSKLSIQ